MDKNEQEQRLRRLLGQHPGCSLLELVQGEVPLEPARVWRHVARMAEDPSQVFPDPQVMARLDRALWDLMARREFLGPTGEALLSVGGLGGLPWARVALAPGAPLVEGLCLVPEAPEFIFLSPSGQSAIALTTEEHGVWLYDVEQRDGELRTRPVNA